jgi:multiple sugar transport system permease protein
MGDESMKRRITLHWPYPAGCGSALYPSKDRWLLLPGLFGFFAFYVVPFGVSAYHATIKSAFAPIFVGIENFIAVANNSFYQLALKNSFLLAIFLPALLIPTALIFALVMRKVPFIRPLQSIFLFPAFLPSSAVASIWHLFFNKGRDFMVALNYQGGIVNSGLNGEWISVFTLALWKNLGIPLVLIMGAFLTLDEELEQAASLDGANGVQRLVHIVLPQLKPTVMFALVYVIMCSQRLFREAYVLYGEYPSESIYLVQHYMNHHFTKLNYQYLASGAIEMAVIIMIVIIPLFRWMRHFNEEAL